MHQDVHNRKGIGQDIDAYSMLVEIITDEAGQPIGWSMQGEDKQEISKLGLIRDLQFFGLGDTVIRYNGRRESDDANGNPGILSWVQIGKQKSE